MSSVSTKTPLLLDGWYSLWELAVIVQTGNQDASTAPSEARRALARKLRVFLMRAVDVAESFGVYSEPSCPTTRHRVHVEGDMATGVEFAQEV